MTNPRPAHATWVSPYITVKDADAAVNFYQKAFHFELKEKAPGEDGTTWHAEMKYKDQLLMFGKQGAYDKECASKTPTDSGVASPINLYIYCEDVNKFYQHAVAAGAKSLAAPEDMFWG